MSTETPLNPDEEEFAQVFNLAIDIVRVQDEIARLDQMRPAGIFEDQTKRSELEKLRKKLVALKQQFKPHETKRIGTRARRQALVEGFLNLIAVQAKEREIRFDRAKMPGTKKQLIHAMGRYNEELEDLRDATQEDYLKRAGCKFRPGRPSKSDKSLLELIPQKYLPTDTI